MTADEYRGALLRLGLDHKTAPEALRVTPRTHYRYWRRGCTGPVEGLLRLAADVGPERARTVLAEARP